MGKIVSFIVVMTGMTLCVGAQSPFTENELSELLRQVMSNQRRMNAQIGEYTSAFKSTLRTFDDKGKLKKESVRSGENYQSWQRNLEITLMKDGRNLSDKNIEKEREKAVSALTRDAEERLRRAEQQATQEGPEYGTDFNNIRISSFDIIRNGRALNPRREPWQGREMIVVDFVPLPNGAPREKNLSALLQMNSTLWIDAGDKVIVRILCRPVSGGRSDEPAFLEESVRMPDGIWLGRYMRFTMAVKPEIFNGQNREWIYERSQHQKFTAQIESEKIEAPRPKP